MLCSKCGNPLEEADVFCPNCGTRVAEEEQETAAPAEITEETVVEPEAEQMPQAQEEAAEAVEETEEAQEEPREEPELTVDAILAEVAAEAAEETEEDAEEEVTADAVYSNPAPPAVEKPKKSKKKIALTITLIVVILLAIGAGAVYFLSYNAYNNAADLVAEKSYAEALELYGKIPFYKDSKEQVSELNRLQKAYDDAGALAVTNDYVTAAAVLSQLGDYRDSLELVSTGLPYLQAKYLMESALTADPAALTQLPSHADTAADAENLAVPYYLGAAELLLGLGEYEDAPLLASQCYREVSFAYMAQGLFEDALACEANMNEADQAAMMEQYMTYCADDGAFADLSEAIRIRAGKETAMADDPDTTYKSLVDAELALLNSYKEDLMYYDQELKALMAQYLEALDKEAATLNEEGAPTSMSDWFAASALRCAVVDQLIEKYDLLSDNPTLQASFAGQSALYQARSAVEKALDEQVMNGEGQYSDSVGDHYVFENTTGYEFSIVLTHDFLDEEGETVLHNESESITVPVGETVNLTFLKPTSGNKWETRVVSWQYEVTLP